MIGAVTAPILFGKMLFLLISENQFTHEIKRDGITSLHGIHERIIEFRNHLMSMVVIGLSQQQYFIGTRTLNTLIGSCMLKEPIGLKRFLMFVCLQRNVKQCWGFTMLYCMADSLNNDYNLVLLGISSETNINIA